MWQGLTALSGLRVAFAFEARAASRPLSRSEESVEQAAFQNPPTKRLDLNPSNKSMSSEPTPKNETPTTDLRFAWWNVQDFAHFDPRRAAEMRWPPTQQAYEEKCERIDSVLNDTLLDHGQLDLLGLGEITRKAADDLRDRCLPGYMVLSMDVARPHRSELQVAFIHRSVTNFAPQEPLVVPYMPRGTRPMAVLDYSRDGHRIRFIGCHWTARFRKSGENRRADIAQHLSHEIYEYLDHNDASEARHVVVLGDLNEDPFGLVEDRLHAHRSRHRALMRPHYTDRDVSRWRLYNLSWRMLGEHLPHDGTSLPTPRSLAGTYYYRAQNSWHTFDQMIVDGSLLTEHCPFIDESECRIVQHPSLFDTDGLPRKLEWFANFPKGCVSDHLPLLGMIKLEK